MRRNFWRGAALAAAISVTAASSARAAAEVSDAWVTTKVKMALMADDVVPGTSIDVDTVDGRVTLHGEVASQTEERKAVEVTRTVEGVRSVENLLRIAPEKSAQDTTTKDTGSASATGSLGATARNAEQSAKDLMVTSATKLSLLADSETPALDINVDTTDGVVTLFGIVPSQKAKEAAEKDAKAVTGVKSVRNQLQVVSKAAQDEVDVADAELETAVTSSIEKKPPLEQAGIGVEVKNGVVRLSGTVPTNDDRLAAARIARSTPGVRAVLVDGLETKAS